jgi:hypothetical protein
MRKTLLLIVYVLGSGISFCQTDRSADFNFGFERIENKGLLPDNWMKWGMEDYILKTDTVQKYSGSASLLIESSGSRENGSFGCVAYSIPAIYEGNQIELRAFLKLQNVEDGQIGLMLRIDGENGGLEFDNLQQNNIRGTSDWTMYSVVLPLPENATKIYIGALLMGTGKLWADDFQILIDGVDISKAGIKKQLVFKADADHEFDGGSTISTLKLTPYQIENLALLGKVWGFLKYFHPAVARGDYNWDYELFRILPKIVLCKDDDDRNQILTKWISALGEFETEITGETEESSIKLKPDLEWITSESILGEQLSIKLIQIRNAKRTDNHYYIGFVPGVGNPKIKNEKPYPGNITYNDAGFRLLSLFRYWNIIQYFFPYKNLIGEDWNNILSEYVPKFINASSELNYKLTLLTLIARIHDTHANIWGYDAALQAFKGSNYAPAEVKFIENQPVVTGFISTKTGKASGLQKGDIIVSVNDKKPEKIVEEKLPFTPASNYSTQLRDIAREMLRTNDSILNITFSRNNSTAGLKIKCYPPTELNLYGNYYKKDTCFKLLTPGIGYIYPGNIKNEYLPRVMDEVQKTKGLIIDMRCYPSDFIVYSLGEYLMPDSAEFVKFSNTSLRNPGLFTFTHPVTVGKKNNESYKGKVIIIVNEITQSQAEFTTMALRDAPEATVIGSTTAGADGNVSEIFLPGAVRTMISGIGVYYPDGKETQRTGIVPDIEVKPTINGILQGRDELLEKAIELINKQ